MANVRTLCLIKPEAVQAGHADNIINNYILNDKKTGGSTGLKVVDRYKITLTPEEAYGFYFPDIGHKPFIKEVVDYMSSGPIDVVVLEGENAIKKYRDILGATVPDEAAAGSVRRDFGKRASRMENAAHGSEHYHAAKREIAYFTKLAKKRANSGTPVISPDFKVQQAR